MHIVFFRNGYANQLFQLCLYFKLKEKYRNDVYAIGENGDFKSNCKELFFSKYLNFIPKLPKKFILVDERNFESLVIKKGKNYFYVGEWQSKIYFPKDLNFIDSIFSYENLSERAKKILKIIKNNNQSVSLHVRRGDYLNSSILSNVSNEIYFKNCVKYIFKLLNKPLFIVFSDDIFWCKSELKLPPSTIYVDALKQNEDIYLMSQCRYRIISNSTYSWWGKTLNKKTSKLVLAPFYWFNYMITAKPLCVSDCVCVENFKHYKKKMLNPLITFILFINNEDKIMINSTILGVMNQNETNIQINIVLKKGDRNASAINYFARLDKRINLFYTNKFFCLYKIPAENCLGKYTIILTPAVLLKPDFSDNIHNSFLEFKFHKYQPKFFVNPNSTIFTRISNFILKYDEFTYISYLKSFLISLFIKIKNRLINF